VDNIAQYCDWVTLVTLGNTCVRERNVVRGIVRRRVTRQLARFIVPDKIARFFELMDAMSGAIIGGFVRHVMSLHDVECTQVFPRTMDIIIPIGGYKDKAAARKMMHFLSNTGPCTEVTEIESLSAFRLSSRFTFLCSSKVCAIADLLWMQ